MAGRRDRSRRGVLLAMGAAGGAALAAGWARGLFARPVIDRRGPNELLPYITPIDQFYKFANGPWPIPATGDERLAVSGAGRSVSLDTQALLGLPRARALRTIVCDGNGYLGQRKPISAGCQVAYDPEDSPDHPEPLLWTWRYGGIGTAEWGGLPLREVFAAAGVPMDAPHVRVEGRDGYARWFPRAVATRDDFLLVVEMNGVALPHEHGSPARIIAPGQYGGMCVKWVRGVTSAQRDGAAPWDGGSASHFPVKPVAFASAPLDGASVRRGEVSLVGAAYGGEHAVHQVLVSPRGEDPVRAELLDPPRPYVWSRWRAVVQLHEPGPALVSIACTDALGRSSMPQSAWGDAVGFGGLHDLHLTVT